LQRLRRKKVSTRSSRYWNTRRRNCSCRNRSSREAPPRPGPLSIVGIEFRRGGCSRNRSHLDDEIFPSTSRSERERSLMFWVERPAGGSAHPLVVHGDCRPWSGRSRGRRPCTKAGLSARRVCCAALGQFAAHRIGDVDLAGPSGRRAEGSVRDHLKTRSVDQPGFFFCIAPVALDASRTSSTPGIERRRTCRGRRRRRLLDAFRAACSTYFFGTIQPRRARGVEGRHSGQASSTGRDMPGVGVAKSATRACKQIVRDAG